MKLRLGNRAGKIFYLCILMLLAFFFFSNQIGNQIFILIGSKFICSSWKFPVLPATAIDK